jgi:hypothetical protein
MPPPIWSQRFERLGLRSSWSEPRHPGRNLPAVEYASRYRKSDETCAFVLKVKADRLAEYKEHHKAVWPEMLDALRRTVA